MLQEILRPTRSSDSTALTNVVATLLIFLKLGWLSVVCVFLSYFFMSIMFPTIFALGIFGLGARAKKASAFIVMAIMGGAILPKLMGYVADKYDMSRGFIVPDVLLRLRGLLRLQLVQIQQGRIVGPHQHRRRALILGTDVRIPTVSGRWSGKLPTCFDRILENRHSC